MCPELVEGHLPPRSAQVSEVSDMGASLGSAERFVRLGFPGE
jgi:hypothetical protein